MNPTLPWLPDGTVYGTLLNFCRERDLWAARALESPYKAPPQAPVLTIKTANTFSPHGAAVALPPGVEAVQVGASLGLIMGKFQFFSTLPSIQRSFVATNSGLIEGIAACVLMNDIAIPHDSYYRPPVPFNCVDGFLGIGAQPVALTALGHLRELKLEVRINGELRQTVDLSTLVRGPATLLADVSAFMTLHPGDVLMLGSDCLADGTRPLARAGDRVEITAPGFAPLVNTFCVEAKS